jgi:hypothetical protein
LTVPPALLSHESTEHYTPQYILDAVIACMGAIDLDPASNSSEIPKVPAARHYTAQLLLHMILLSFSPEVSPVFSFYLTSSLNQSRSQTLIDEILSGLYS